MSSLGKRPINFEAPDSQLLSLCAPFAWARERTSIKMYNIESTFVIGPSNILFSGVYVSVHFQKGLYRQLRPAKYSPKDFNLKMCTRIKLSWAVGLYNAAKEMWTTKKCCANPFQLKVDSPRRLYPRTGCSPRVCFGCDICRMKLRHKLSQFVGNVSNRTQQVWTRSNKHALTKKYSYGQPSFVLSTPMSGNNAALAG